MELIQHHCKNCGGELAPYGSDKLKCTFCGTIFDTVSAEKHTKQMKDLFDETKQEAINNLRRNLYNAVNAEYISSTQVHEICVSLKKYLPDDFQANFYDIASGSNVRQITRSIRDIDVEAHYEDLDGAVEYLIRSMQPEYLLELNNLVERAYKMRDLAKFEKYSTEISKEAEKVQLGIYETKLPREVFVAYSSKDMDKVSMLVEILEAQGMKCFVAARNLRHGKGSVENYDKALKEAIDHCRSFVFISSRNSRSIGCDALGIEIPYVQKKDIENAPAEYRNNYAAIPHKYKKPRVEYRVEESHGLTAADAITNEFFDGYERVYSPDEVAQRIMKQLLQTPDIEAPAKPQSSSASKKYCAACGTENDMATKFCGQCGNTQFFNSLADFVKATNQQQEALRQEAERAKKAAEEDILAAKRRAEQAQREAEQAQREAAEAKKQAKYSSNSGSSSYGYSPYSSSQSHTTKSSKNFFVTLILCYVFGMFGAHRFYVGKKKSGKLYLCSLGILGIGWIIDLLCILLGKFEDAYGYAISYKKE